MLRRPPKLPEPSFGPELPDAGRTAIGIRSALITEGGVLGITLAPEATLAVESIAFSISAAVPVRFELKERPTVGTFQRTRDYFRFLRGLSLGLPDADVELSFSRLSDYSLADGFLVERYAPGVAAAGVPGLSVETSPLTFFGGVRTEWFRLEALLDDVFDPAVFGAGATVPIGDLPIFVGAAFASDQKANREDARRAINAVEADLRVEVVQTRDFSFDASVLGAATRVLGATGFGASLLLDAEVRFGGYDRAVRLKGRASYLGPGSLEALFGPTYPVSRPAHLEALGRVGGRPILGAELALRLGHLTLGGAFGSGIGAERDPLDQTVEALVELSDLEITRARFLDVRLAYSSRSLFRDEPRLDVMHGTVRFRWASWFFTELYFKKGETYEGGGGLTIAWMP